MVKNLDLNPALVTAALNAVEPSTRAEAIHCIQTCKLYYGTTGLAKTNFNGAAPPTRHILPDKKEEILRLADDIHARHVIGLSPAAKATMTAQGVNRATEQLVNLMLKARNNQNASSAAGGDGHSRLRSLVKHPSAVYHPGVRVINALPDENAQMMDFYYGDRSVIFRKRNLSVAKVLHHLLGFKGEFNPGISGRLAYLNSTIGKIEGWEHNCEFSYRINDSEERDKPFTGTNNKLQGLYTVTQAMSWFFRYMVRTHGGTIYFEGSNIAYDAVFTQTLRGISDSQLEAFRLFKYMNSMKSNFSMGRGEVIYTFANKPTPPTRALFLSNWTYERDRLPQPGSAALTNHLWNLFE